MTSSLHGDRHTGFVISRSVHLTMRNVAHRHYR